MPFKHKRSTVWVILSVLLANVLVVPVSALWPQPRSFTAGSSAILLAKNFDISIPGLQNPPADLRDAITRTKGFLQNDKLERLVVGRGAADASIVSNAKSLSKLTLTLGGNGTALSITSEAQKPLGSRDEAYVLTVPSDGSGATLSANSTLGLFRGLTTFSQLWYESQGSTYALDVPISIQDSPAYVRDISCSHITSADHLGYTCSPIVDSCLTPHGTCTSVSTRLVS